MLVCVFKVANQSVTLSLKNQSQFRLSDEDVLRLARQVQTFLKDEIDQLIEIKVTESFEQEIAGMKDVIVQLQCDMKDMMTKIDELENVPVYLVCVSLAL